MKGFVMKNSFSLKLFIFIFLFGIVTINMSAQEKNKHKQEVVAKVGSENITYEALEKAFQKNMNRKNLTLAEVHIDSVMEFLDLYSKYRLKVQDAISRGFDKDSSVMDDIEQNRKILAETYYYEKKLMNPWLERMINRRGEEFKIAVMVFTFPPVPNADPNDALNKAKNCLELLKNGVPFQDIARDSSDDPETGKIGGLVKTWITSGNVQRAIENAIFSLKPGEFSDIVSTRYGYFIIKLLDKQSRKFVKASHILLTYSETDSTDIRALAEDIVEKLKKGANFAELAKQYSKDPQSASKGGELDGYYSRSTGYEKTNRRLVPEFEEALFKLKDGEISDIVPTVYGFHVIKRDSTKEYDRENEDKDLKSIYKKSYYDDDKTDFLDSLHKSYGFKINEETLQKMLSGLDTNKTNLEENWAAKVPNELYSSILYEFLNVKSSVSEFITLMQKSVELRGLGLNRNGLLRAIDKIISPKVMKEATKSLEKEYPDFSLLMNEFRDGILLFKVEQMEVWDKLKFDSVLAREYWDTTKTRYKTLPAYDFSEIYVLSDSAAQDLYRQLKNGADFTELAEANTQRKGFREKKGYWGEVFSDKNDLVKAIAELKPKDNALLEPIPYEKGFSVVKINKFLPVRQKTFEEAITDFAPQFQDLMQKRLLNNWLNELKKKFEVKLHKNKIVEVNKKLKK